MKDGFKKVLIIVLPILILGAGIYCLFNPKDSSESKKFKPHPGTKVFKDSKYFTPKESRSEVIGSIEDAKQLKDKNK
ncbi:MAG: hypothetical protein KDD53_01390 [Bdellovibrionales bacterium]|nr:hypothetical protein [Bdellovibrionales bacterium]